MTSDEDAIVVTGFEPFGGRPRNRSWDVVRRFGARTGVRVLQLPVDFARLKAEIPELMTTKPRALLMLGESPDPGLRVEQVAVNILDADGADNAGARPRIESVVSGGPRERRASWDAGEVALRLNEHGITAAASLEAGTHACNAALYLALHSPGRSSIGFLHVPYPRWPVGMRMGVLLRAVDLCLRALVARAEVRPEPAAATP